MSKLLCVGRIEGAFATEAAIEAAKEVKAVPTTWFGRVKTDLVPWLNCSEAMGEWDLLNDASVSLFLRHAAELEGIQAENRIGHSQWLHLLDYQETYWLPLDLPAVRIFKSSDGWPIAIASAKGLLQNLVALKKTSALGLGERPAALNPESRSSMSPEDTVRWIWVCLYEAASIAVTNNAPLAALP